MDNTTRIEFSKTLTDLVGDAITQAGGKLDDGQRAEIVSLGGQIFDVAVDGAEAVESRSAALADNVAERRKSTTAKLFDRLLLGRDA
jgi:hypothetical protein